MCSSQNIRVFLEISPAPAQCAELQKQLCQFKTRLSSSSLRWITEENWHMTLKFMGNTEPQKTSQLIPELKEELLRHTSFQLKLTHLDWLPNAKKPIVLAAISGQCEPLNRLVTHIDETLTRYAFEPEAKAFRPHLSLARTPIDISPDVIEQLPLAINPVIMHVNKISLKQSTSKKQTVYYSKLASFPLLS